MEIKLTKPQAKFKEAITWLLHPYAIGGGRTFLLAVIWIDIAKNFHYDWIHIFDHRPKQYLYHDYLIDSIKMLEPQMKFRLSDRSIMWDGPKVTIKYKPWGIENNPYITAKAKKALKQQDKKKA